MPGELTEDQIDQILNEVKSGRKLEAVKLYRKWADCSLYQAKISVEALAAGDGATDGRSGVDEKMMDEILDAIQRGEKLSAIKIYKTQTGVGLKESKEFVECLMSELGVEDKGGVGCAGVLMGLMVLGAAVCGLA